jgi:hypothetical protein
MQCASILICDGHPKLVEALVRYNRRKSAGKTSAPELRGTRAAKELNVTGFVVTGGAQKACLSHCISVFFHDAQRLASRRVSCKAFYSSLPKRNQLA